MQKQALGFVLLIGAPLLGAALLLLSRSSGSSPFDLTLALTAGSVFAGAVVSGVAGFAFSAVSGALLLQWVPAVTAVPLLLACSITTQLLSIASLWRTMQWRHCARFLVGGFAGIPLGAKLLESLDARVFAAGFGAFLVCYCAYMLMRPKAAIACSNRFADVVAGFAGGVTGGSIAFPGAIPTIWCSIRGLAKHEQRGIVQPFILTMQIATLVYFSKLGIVASETIVTYVFCVPAVLAGTWVGLRLFQRVDDAAFRRLVLIFLLVSGAVLIL